MNYYKTIRQSVKKRRILMACILLALGILAIAFNIGTILAYMKGPVDLTKVDTDAMYLDKHEGEFVTINVTDLVGYTNGYDGAVKDKMYKVIPTKKSGWIVEYKGGIQYCELISYGKYNNEFVKAYKELLEFDEGKADKPDISITVRGRVVKKNGIWKRYFEKYADELVDDNVYENVKEVKDSTGGDYVIEMSQAVPVDCIVVVLAGIILILLGVYVLIGYIVCSGSEQVVDYLTTLDRIYLPEEMNQDYLNGNRYGNTVIGEKFLYYVKGLDVKVLYLPQIESIERNKYILTSTIVIKTIYGKIVKYKVNVRYGKVIVKMVRAYLQELMEFGIEE